MSENKNRASSRSRTRPTLMSFRVFDGEAEGRPRKTESVGSRSFETGSSIPAVNSSDQPRVPQCGTSSFLNSPTIRTGRAKSAPNRLASSVLGDDFKKGTPRSSSKAKVPETSDYKIASFHIFESAPNLDERKFNSVTKSTTDSSDETDDTQKEDSPVSENLSHIRFGSLRSIQKESRPSATSYPVDRSISIFPSSWRSKYNECDAICPPKQSHGLRGRRRSGSGRRLRVPRYTDDSESVVEMSDRYRSSTLEERSRREPRSDNSESSKKAEDVDADADVEKSDRGAERPKASNIKIQLNITIDAKDLLRKGRFLSIGGDVPRAIVDKHVYVNGREVSIDNDSNQ